MNISTAPRWSEEDEQRDIESLSDLERRKVRSDLFGQIAEQPPTIADPFQQDKEGCTQLSNGCYSKPMHNALELVGELIMAESSKKSAAYLQAKQENSTLLEEEAKLELFLEHEDHDARAACERVLSYWSTRKDLFGDRAFCPMQLDKDDGALFDEDKELLKTSGLFQMLPDDRHGRPVLFLQRSSFWQSATESRSLMRCWFYLLSVALKRQQSSDNGIVVVSNFKYFASTNYDRRAFKAFFSMLTSVFPVRISAIHFCYATRRSAFELVLPVIKQLMSPHLRRRLLVHVGDDKTLRYNLKEKYGIADLHESLGGTISFDSNSLNDNQASIQDRDAVKPSSVDGCDRPCEKVKTQPERIIFPRKSLRKRRMQHPHLSCSAQQKELPL